VVCKNVTIPKVSWQKPANESGSHNCYLLDCARALMETDSDLSHILWMKTW